MHSLPSAESTRRCGKEQEQSRLVLRCCAQLRLGKNFSQFQAVWICSKAQGVDLERVWHCVSFNKQCYQVNSIIAHLRNLTILFIGSHASVHPSSGRSLVAIFGAVPDRASSLPATPSWIAPHLSHNTAWSWTLPGGPPSRQGCLARLQQLAF